MTVHNHDRDCYEDIDRFQRFHFCTQRPNVYYDSVKKVEMTFEANIEAYGIHLMPKRMIVEYWDTKLMSIIGPLTAEELADAQSRETGRARASPSNGTTGRPMSKVEMVAFAVFGAAVMFVFAVGAFTIYTASVLVT